MDSQSKMAIDQQQLMYLSTKIKEISGLVIIQHCRHFTMFCPKILENIQ